MSHTLFFLCAQLEMFGKENFKLWLKRQGYSEAAITEIRQDMAEIKGKGKVNYSKVYEAK